MGTETEDVLNPRYKSLNSFSFPFLIMIIITKIYIIIHGCFNHIFCFLSFWKPRGTSQIGRGVEPPRGLGEIWADKQVGRSFRLNCKHGSRIIEKVMINWQVYRAKAREKFRKSRRAKRAQKKLIN